jgi:cytoskeletal protein CcmA (bactofilin family)
MDPSQVQSDKDNDTDSLEKSDGNDAPKGQPASEPAQQDGATPKAEDGVTDATGGSGAPAASPFQHRSFIRRLWDRLNIYLLLFILVLVIAIGSVVTLTVKGRQDAYKIITTQELTQDELKQLANTDVTVGDPKQILTVQANAVFAGSTLIRGDMEVAGTLKLGGDLSLTNLNVTGATQLEDATANNLTVGSNLNVQGTLQLNGGISVAGQSNFNGGIVASSIITGALQLNGDLNLTHHITAGGTIPGVAKGSAVGGGGTVSLSGSDTSGAVAINTGSLPPAGCFATVTFSEAYNTTPHVVVTPVGAAAAGLNYYITRSTTNFVICSTNAAPAGQSFGFDYVVMG